MIATVPPYRKSGHKLDFILPESPFKLLGSATLAVDTEFCDTHTLTVQVATRLDSDRLAVQIYSNPSIPPLPVGLKLEQFVPLTSDAMGDFASRLFFDNRNNSRAIYHRRV